MLPDGMKVRATKVMADLINRTAKERGVRLHASLMKMSREAYSRRVGSPFDGYDYGDRDEATGQFRAILVEYPADYYAMPRLLGSKEIVEICSMWHCKTVEDLGNQLINELEA